jgi:uncharacterized repeat protein (TIGR01451 family)
MNKIFSDYIRKPVWICALAVLLTAVAVMASTGIAFAQETGNVCVQDYRPGITCTANDVKISLFYVNQVAPVCQNVGDTATAYMTAQLVATSNLRYDIGLFVAMDGGSALSGDSCYHDYLHPISNTATPSGQDRFAPFYDAEGDTCGDIEQNINNFYDLAPITITCKDDDNDKQVDPISACVSWEQNANAACSGVTDAIPGSPSKCNCESIPVDVFIRDADIKVDKQAPTSVQFGDTFNYTFVVTNLGPDIANNTRFDGADAIPDGLQILSTTPDDTGANTLPFPTPPYCTFTNTGSYQGGSVDCTVGDLAVNSSYTIQVQVQLDPNYPATKPPDMFNSVCVTSDVDDPVPGNNCDSTSTTTPVSIAYFNTSTSGSGTHIEWATATQVGNVGFNIYAQTDGGLVKVNDQLIPAGDADSFSPQQYSFDAVGVTAQAFFIEDVDLTTNSRMHGPFAVNQTFGAVPQVEAIDWAAINAESDAKASQRVGEFLTHQALLTGFSSPPAHTDQAIATSVVKLYLPVAVKFVSYNASDYPAFNLSVDKDGIYRVTYEDLKAAGLDLAGVKPTDLALTNRGVAVPIYVESSMFFGEGAYIEFYGQALNTLYTHTNVYVLSVDPSQAARIAVDPTEVAQGASPASFYMETATVERNRVYGFASPNGDPWYDTSMLVYTTPKTWSYTINVQDYLPAFSPAYLSVGLWGGTDWAASLDHHVIAGLNGTPIANKIFNGITSQVLTGQVPSGVLAEGSNTLQLTLPGDTGVQWDISNLDKYSVTYPRAFKAINDTLSFSAASNAFQVDGFSGSGIVAYRLDGAQPVRLGIVNVGGSSGTYSASFAGSGMNTRYLVSTESALLAPRSILPAGQIVDITSGSYNYIMIAHPDFLADSDPGYYSTGLGRLVAAKEAEGYSVKVVNVEDIYAQFGYGIFDPLAIRAYIAYAAHNMGTQYVLLVGGDTYDYFDYTGKNSKSFIPSLYTGTGIIVNYAPVDPMFTDLNRDNVPDLAIGRFPVRNSAELASIVDKTLLYANKSYSGSAILAADGFDGIASYTSDSEQFATQLDASWAVVHAYIDDLGVSEARTALIDAMNNGAALVSYVGHSGPTVWSLDGLFNSADAAALTNAGKPFVVSQWGCWNTYFTDPGNNTLAHKFLLSGDRGAAAVMGATTLTFQTSEARLGKLMMGRLVTPGMTIGQAMLTAKQQMAQQYPGMLDALLGWTILGDPTLVIQQ